MPGTSGQTIASSVNHQRLMAVADVIREQAPLARRARLDHEHRLRPLDDRRRRSRGSSSTRQSPPRSTVPRGSAVPNSTPPSDRRRPRAFSRSSQPSVIVSRA